MRFRALFAALPILLAASAATAEGVSPRPEGGWRVEFSQGQSALSTRDRHALAGIAQTLAPIPAGRITVQAQASGPADDASIARRLSLARAAAVRDALVAAGLVATRVDIRALGRLEPPADIAEILPPGVPRATPGTR
ncbi:OmpA family protein [Falsiroseomonas sp. HC035]|uniref:OmpA family protein n=1 Tax=Falsiroseomonas sp. HC035 TaxID=3390999 RepID=UPI003D320C18